jgi:hypothetical protein
MNYLDPVILDDRIRKHACRDLLGGLPCFGLVDRTFERQFEVLSLPNIDDLLKAELLG